MALARDVRVELASGSRAASSPQFRFSLTRSLFVLALTTLTSARGAERGAARRLVSQLRGELRRRERLARRQTLSACDVVCCTCVGAAQRALRDFVAPRTELEAAGFAGGERETTFDVAVIDEAAQALEASCWIPIALASRVGASARRRATSGVVTRAVAQCWRATICSCRRRSTATKVCVSGARRRRVGR